jgi:hypothetical protein
MDPEVFRLDSTELIVALRLREGGGDPLDLSGVVGEMMKYLTFKKRVPPLGQKGYGLDFLSNIVF